MNAAEGQQRANEIARECERIVNAGLTWVALVIPMPKGGVTGERVRLDKTSRRACPMGTPTCVNSAGQLVAHFKAIEVLAWLAARRLIVVVERAGLTSGEGR